ncbi:hypothetical protein [Homoserinibacter sp. GY 40078]|uniref:hypothetical protein n=1 Tax=Homoserinibacter sp. GY 40078 TaxID=2603275 RepID=UPI0011C6FCF4|nr:hypothetical protein [Homoserinibacter sp. GY 40078]TXK16369.1 hypothetical protein FVQ89_14055 [Homoserinibacter sp. GY 40078]
MTIPGAAALALVLAFLAGCASTTSDTASDEPTEATIHEDGFTSFDAAIEEYWATAEKFPLPAGEEYPEPTFDDASGSYQAGYGETEAVGAWNCAWGREYLEAFGTDPEREATALAEYSRLVETDAFARSYDPESAQSAVYDSIEKAKLGDPSRVQSVIDGGCPQ